MNMFRWMKLPEDFFEDARLKAVENAPGGAEAVLLYIKLLLRSMNTGGVVPDIDGEAMELLRQNGLISANTMGGCRVEVEKYVGRAAMNGQALPNVTDYNAVFTPSFRAAAAAKLNAQPIRTPRTTPQSEGEKKARAAIEELIARKQREAKEMLGE